MRKTKQNEDRLQVQGLTVPYTFPDADGGSDGGESVADVHRARDQLVGHDPKDAVGGGGRRDADRVCVAPETSAPSDPYPRNG